MAHLYDGRWRRPLDRAEDAVVRAWVAPSAGVDRILDLGCGTGLFLDLFPDVPCDIYAGFDVSERMLREARRKHPGHVFAVGDMDDPWAWGGRVGAVVGGRVGAVVSLFGSCSYSTDPALLIKRAAASLRPGGILRLMFMTERYSRVPEATFNVYPDVPAPASYLTGDEIAGLMDDAGLRDVKVEGFRYLPNLVATRLPESVLRAVFEAERGLIGSRVRNHGPLWLLAGATK